MKASTSIAPTFGIVSDDNGKSTVDVRVLGDALLRSPLTNKGTAFTRAERTELGLVGLLPPRVETLEEQTTRAYASYRRETTPLGRHRFLRRLQDTNEVLYYALLRDHIGEMLPIVYTPTVGEGVERFSDIYEEPRGISLSIEDAEGPEAVLARYPLDDVRMIVATDSSAILGIGDQGYNGLAISIGKLSLYTLGGGVSPMQTLPVVLDVGTDRVSLLDDPTYLGVRAKRLHGEAHLEFVRKFALAVQRRWPKAIVQWEDFGKETAFDVLDALRDEIPSFNDDIQGTGAVALAGLLAATRGKGGKLASERFLVFGAGAGGIGVARAIQGGLEHEGLSRADALARIFVVDSKGLLVEGRPMEPYKQAFAQPAHVTADWTKAGKVPTLIETIQNAKITALLGLSGQPASFDENIVRSVMKNTSRPIVFALSNPTSACEAVPADVLRWSAGNAIVATGSPFEPVEIGGKLHTIGQGNNAFIFPGLGLGAIVTEARKITDGMVADAAHALADFTIERYGKDGLVYPPVEDLREASVYVAVRVIRRAIADGVAARTDLPNDLAAHVRSVAWTPRYLPFRYRGA
ncbi:MAG TPA: NAD-dependent malic enzyme [Labilithrix sp.]|jgi:malate dehydrogenase (oxaloacetate-decarboxylating)|nr:NAD-dependent malic enzyme [Labilithrix sp.]